MTPNNLAEWCKNLPDAKERETWKIGKEIVPRPMADETLSFIQERNVAPTQMSDDLQGIWYDESKNAGFSTIVPMVVSRKGHKIGQRDAYADATFRSSSNFPYIRVILHPTLLYQDEEYVRSVIRHELSHIKSLAKRSKKIRDALG